MKHLAVLFVLLAACSGSSTSSPGASPGPASGSSQPPPPPPPKPDPGGDPTSADITKLGQPCTDGACSAGITCVKYYGIAGPRGPQFSSCEIPCNVNQEKSECPAGTHCSTIADGPGAVCRPH